LAIFVCGRLDLGSREIYGVAILYLSSESAISSISPSKSFVA
jgi:hypothetical protein